MTAAAPAITLVCPECRRANEIERIYCHDCGARLDRSATAARHEPKVESREETHERLLAMFDQRQAKIRFWTARARKLVLGAAVAAAVLQMSLPPDVPPAAAMKVLPPQINMDLEMMTMYRRPAALRYAQDDVNAYLANALRGKKNNLSHSVLNFNRALVTFAPGSCRVVVARELFGYPLYTTAVYATAVSNGKLTATPLSGSIGRLPVHPALVKYTSFVWSDVVNALDREHRLLDRVGAVEFGDKTVTLVAPGRKE